VERGAYPLSDAPEHFVQILGRFSWKVLQMQAFIARAVSAIYREAELWILEAGMLLADRVNQKTSGTAAVSATVPFDVLALLERSSCQI